ncbi:MAG: PIG-L family deacetylase [Bacteroidales bacterium]|nr:PIG-L family deacetylase [Bacteroidales bacterium]
MVVVLVVCAHADDEAFGIAGTLARHVANGDEVHLLFLADGVTSRASSFDPALHVTEIAARKQMAVAAAEAIGAKPPRFLDLKDNRLDGVEILDVVKAIEAVIDDVQPAIVYTNHSNDLNVDHRVAHRAVLTACRPLPNQCVCEIYAFETLSSTEWEPYGGGAFQPARFVNISDFTWAKLAAIRAYGVETRSFPHPRSTEAVEALWRFRGAQAGFSAAEALVVVRERV